jgi:hypothetical protein
MAQTRSSSARSRPAGSKRSSSKRSNASGSKARASSSRSSNGRSSKPRATSRNASGSRRRTSASSKAKSSGSPPRGKGQTAQQRKTAQRGRSTSQGGQSTVAKVAEKARTPALAGGAVLLGLAGGVALNNRRKGLLSGGSKLSLPRLDLAKRLPTPNGSVLEMLGDAATEVGKGSSKVQGWASQVQKAAETISPESPSDD